MAQERRSNPTSDDKRLDHGILLARVVSYLDPEFMGGLEVTLLREQGNTVGANQQTYSVKYASPFYGVTGYEYMGLNKADFTDTQKSYGMWFPTPEIGTTVLVAFVEGDPSQGYYIACVPGRFMNQMIPAIGASSEVELTEEDKKRYDTDQPLPVGEVNRKANSQEKSLEIDKIKKPVHPIANRFLEQGLLEDDVRGPAQTSSRRSLPNTVFGISTPGPIDRSDLGKKQFVGKKETRTTSAIPVGRTGGTQFVMDDGNERFRRASSASSGPIDYIDTLNPQEKRAGDPDIPYGEHVRIRTRTGHQILLHNSEDLIYIGNSRGTTWIELTSNGKIDIYAEDSISIHTEADINMRADRDINMEAGRNINMRTVGGRFHADVNGNMELVVSGDSFLTTLSDLHIRTTGSSKISSGAGLDVSTVGTNKISSTAEFNLASGGQMALTATGGNIGIKGSNVIVQGGEIHLNGPAAPTASNAESATSAQTLSLYDNPATSSSEEWGDKNRYKLPEYVKSIMRRIPMHEPWPLHENFNPSVLASQFTDRDILSPEPVKPEDVNTGPSTGTGTGTGTVSGTGTGTGGGTDTGDGSFPEEGPSPNPGDNGTPSEGEGGEPPAEENTKPEGAPTIEEQKEEYNKKISPLVTEYNELSAEYNTERQEFARLRKEQTDIQEQQRAAEARGDFKESNRLNDVNMEYYRKVDIEVAKIKPLKNKLDSILADVNKLKAERDAVK